MEEEIAKVKRDIETLHADLFRAVETFCIGPRGVKHGVNQIVLKEKQLRKLQKKHFRQQLKEDQFNRLGTLDLLNQ